MWPSLVGFRFWEPEIGGSNPPTPTKQKEKGGSIMQKLTLFERLLLLTLNRILYLVGIPAKDRTTLGDLLYRLGRLGEITKEDLKFFD